MIGPPVVVGGEGKIKTLRAKVSLNWFHVHTRFFKRRSWRAEAEEDLSLTKAARYAISRPRRQYFSFSPYYRRWWQWSTTAAERWETEGCCSNDGDVDSLTSAEKTLYSFSIKGIFVWIVLASESMYLRLGGYTNQFECLMHQIHLFVKSSLS